MGEGSPDSVLANIQDCNIIVSIFKPHSQYCIHSWVNTLGKDMSLLIHPPARA